MEKEKFNIEEFINKTQVFIDILNSYNSNAFKLVFVDNIGYQLMVDLGKL